MRVRHLAAMMVALALAAAAAPPAFGKIAAFDEAGSVRDSHLVVAARVESLEKGRGRFAVEKVLKGLPDVKSLGASTMRSFSCIGPPQEVTLPAGARVLLFLGQSLDDDYPVIRGGAGWLQPQDSRWQETVDAIATVVAAEASADAGARMKAYLEALEGGNAVLRGIAARVVSADLHGKEKAAPFEDRLVALLRSPSVEARRAATHALQFSCSGKALPALLESVADEDRVVRESASMALGRYDTEATVRSLVEAARRPDMLPRVMIDLRESRRPEALELFRGLLKSADAEIRKRAAQTLATDAAYNRCGYADIYPLVSDPDRAVRLIALKALEHSWDPGTVTVLLGALRNQDRNEAEEAVALASLEAITSSPFDSPRGPKDVRQHALLQVLRDAPDFPGLMERALLGKDRTWSVAITLLRRVGNTGSKDLLRRVADGAWGAGPAEHARKALERLEAR